jgi:inner membrane protein
MFIPLNLVSGVVDDRARYSTSTIESISREWGGAQLLSGPMLVIPVTEDVTYERKREAVDPTTGQTLRDGQNNIVYEHFEETRTEARAPVYLFPEAFDLQTTSRTQERHRGIFVVPVYTAEAEMQFDFNAPAATEVLTGDEVLQWDRTELRLTLSENRALRGEAVLEADGAPLPLEPIPATAEGGQVGIFAALGDPRKLERYTMRLTLNGAQSLGAAAVGRTSRVTMTSDWPDPSFYGDFLPDTSEVTEQGFTATWSVPHLARSLPQVSRRNPDPVARDSATMGVRFITPNDFYQKAWRSARYGILFIALTFLTILLLDRTSERPAHPVQYLMVGLAQSVFILLMLSYAEQIGFGAAYFLSAGATIGLLVVFGATALKLGKRTSVLAAMLIVVYGVLYLILRSADYALLAGSTLAFVALAGTMLLTRNEDWYGPERAAWRPFARRTPKEPSVA